LFLEFISYFPHLFSTSSHLQFLTLFLAYGVLRSGLVAAFGCVKVLRVLFHPWDNYITCLVISTRNFNILVCTIYVS